MNNYYTIQPTKPEIIHNAIVSDSGITSNWKYRQYIQKNANEIMKSNAMDYINSSGNNPYTLMNTNTVGNTPFLYSSVHDDSQPLYGYKMTDLKQSYLTKERMKSRMIAPTIPTNF